MICLDLLNRVLICCIWNLFGYLIGLVHLACRILGLYCLLDLWLRYLLKLWLIRERCLRLPISSKSNLSICRLLRSLLGYWCRLLLPKIQCLLLLTGNLKRGYWLLLAKAIRLSLGSGTKVNLLLISLTWCCKHVSDIWLLLRSSTLIESDLAFLGRWLLTKNITTDTWSLLIIGLSSDRRQILTARIEWLILKGKRGWLCLSKV